MCTSIQALHNYPQAMRNTPFYVKLYHDIMVNGCEESYPPGKAIATDRKCSNRDFCDFYDAEALQSDAVAEGRVICVGCNDELDRNAFTFVDSDTINKSRDKQMPDGWN